MSVSLSILARGRITEHNQVHILPHHEERRDADAHNASKFNRREIEGKAVAEEQKGSVNEKVAFWHLRGLSKLLTGTLIGPLTR
jgi:hypothetical protein